MKTRAENNPSESQEEVAQAEYLHIEQKKMMSKYQYG
jgi:hypothetical protein